MFKHFPFWTFGFLPQCDTRGSHFSTLGELLTVVIMIKITMMIVLHLGHIILRQAGENSLLSGCRQK